MLVDEAAATAWLLSGDDTPHSDMDLNVMDSPSLFPMSSPCVAPRYGSRSSILSNGGGSAVSGSSSGGEARAQRKGASSLMGGEGDVNGSAQQQPEDGSVGGAITAAAAGMRLSRARL